MRRSLVTIITAFAMLLAAAPTVRPSSIEFTDAAAPRQIKWPKKSIAIALSASLSSPGANVKAGSDVFGAVRRALSRWAAIADLTFAEVSSTANSISHGSGGDGVSLITIADTPENNSIFGSADIAGRTRIFYDRISGAIVEADVVINPHPAAADGAPMQFSTDGTPGTYDLEATFMHELGHFLGLEHSSVVGSTMQPRQGVNGVYKLPALTERTLSETDRTAVRSLYGPAIGSGAIEGKLLNASLGSVANPFGAAHVWVEDTATGRVVGSSDVSQSNGSYRIADIPPGHYRVLADYSHGLSFATEGSTSPAAKSAVGQVRAFRTTEVSNEAVVNANVATLVDFASSPAQNAAPFLKPILIGTNGELSTTPVPAEAGKRFTFYVAGDGVDQVSASGVSVTSPYLAVDPGSLVRQQFGSSFPVISFDIIVAANASFGDYSIRLQSNTGEVAYVPGCITIDPGVESSFPNPADDARFFVTQHYRDFLAREPDRGGLEYWVNKLAHCESDSDCIRARRIEISASFFIETEFQETGSFVYRLYQAALGRRPAFSEFEGDRSVVGTAFKSGKEALATVLVRRQEFLQKYPATLEAEQFVDSLLSSVLKNSGVGLSSERAALVASYDGSDAGRARIVSLIADNALFSKSEYSRAFVLMQYFSYLRRDPDEGGYKFWLNTLNRKLPIDPTAYRSVVCAFINSAEYQERFGMLVTHSDKECTP